MKKRIVVLISGRGRNLQALIQASACGELYGRVTLVVSNRADAAGLAYAQAAGIATRVLPHRDYPSREAFDAELARVVGEEQPDAVALAGFMRILTPAFVTNFRGRLLNIHPSLLPKYPGLDTHARALAAGDSEHGATVHFVTEQLDGGPAILQGRVPVLPGDTPESLALRVLEQVELRIYPQALAWLLSGDLVLRDGVAWLRGRRLEAPLAMDG